MSSLAEAPLPEPKPLPPTPDKTAQIINFPSPAKPNIGLALDEGNITKAAAEALARLEKSNPGLVQATLDNARRLGPAPAPKRFH